LDETAEVGHVTVQEADETDSEMDHAEVLKSSGECFTKSFFDSVVVYTISCFEIEDDKTNEEVNVPPGESGDGSIQLQLQRKEKNERTISVSCVKQANVAAIKNDIYRSGLQSCGRLLCCAFTLNVHGSWAP